MHFYSRKCSVLCQSFNSCCYKSLLFCQFFSYDILNIPVYPDTGCTFSRVKKCTIILKINYLDFISYFSDNYYNFAYHPVSA